MLVVIYLALTVKVAEHCLGSMMQEGSKTENCVDVES